MQGQSPLQQWFPARSKINPVSTTTAIRIALNTPQKPSSSAFLIQNPVSCDHNNSGLNRIKFIYLCICMDPPSAAGRKVADTKIFIQLISRWIPTEGETTASGTRPTDKDKHYRPHQDPAITVCPAYQFAPANQPTNRLVHQFPVPSNPYHVSSSIFNKLILIRT